MVNDVIVVGGGVIGLAAAWRTARRGAAVTLIDPAPRRGASWAAAGMLAPVTEARFGESALTRLCVAGADRWPSFDTELIEASGMSTGLRRTGTLLVALDAGDAAELDRLHGYLTGLGLDARRLRGPAARDGEPLLAPDVRHALLAASDHRVDPRAVTAALLAALRRAGAGILASTVREVRVRAGRVTGVVLDDGTERTAGAVVLATGWRPVPADGRAPPVRPVKGQIVTVRAAGRRPYLTRTVRGVVRGRPVYLVPRDDGRVVVGATVEERGADTTVTAGAVADLLDDAAALVPGVRELELAEAIAGLRPATPDDGPIIGPGPAAGLIVATGHYRNGMLLAPITADAVVALLCGQPVPDEVRPFGAARFGDRHEEEPPCG